MKKLYFFFIFVFSLLSSCTSDDTTTYYLIRHAEKDKTDTTNRNPNLNEKGLERAIKWAERFKNVQIDAVYSTKYNRTLQTGTPTAVSKNLEIKNYNPSKMYDSIFQKETKGKTVLIVGHSNTTPVFANKILGEKKYKDMDENDNSTLFIVTINGNKRTSKTEKVN
ncbi:histidine phosphatase family protein [Polaribacter sp. MSW13]|uniref:Histidine phosphatase family protein n=1 Tax=Polaribacter marinus TaxID=2916838 RepID=A0A9X2AJJ8_9FLAO|nr:phosphoglycerate mutase family protein [Polaribacter marinus]MCI2228463.1 histidine phosphatase family protein [Polaribacter marinus]